MRRAWLLGREKVLKRYLIHVAGYNLGLIALIVWAIEGQIALLAISLQADPFP